MIQDERFDTTAGVAQGSVLSPLLANVYLHYVLDEWFHDQVQLCLRGEATIVRYADDFICTFELESDARRFEEVLGKRLGRYSLELAEDMHYCGRSRAGKFKLKRRTSVKKYGAKVRDRYLEHHPLPLPGKVKDLIAMGRTP